MADRMLPRGEKRDGLAGSEGTRIDRVRLPMLRRRHPDNASTSWWCMWDRAWWPPAGAAARWSP